MNAKPSLLPAIAAPRATALISEYDEGRVKDSVFRMRLPIELKRSISDRAAKAGVSVSRYVRALIEADAAA